MPTLFAVIRAYSPAWDRSAPMEAQPGWGDHARFMDGLAGEGFVVAGGPLAGTEEVLLIVRARDRADVAARLAADPWGDDLLRLVRVEEWTLRLGALDSA